jgi:hypothetical protein
VTREQQQTGFGAKQGTMHSVVTRSGDATVQVRYDTTNQPEYRGTVREEMRQWDDLGDNGDQNA